MGKKSDADEGCGVAYSGEGESPDGASAVVAVANHDEGQADGLVRIRVEGSRRVFGDVDLVANGSAVAAAVDGHRGVGERHGCRDERRNNSQSLLPGNREGDATEPVSEFELLDS